ncbi:HAD family phosphatase [Sphingomonas sp.]|jgi:HAD superfamily hydrolase (TIGR01490 family)|uniref:HAD family hydrolase n=1 Tax=Sphingomonas sp. TaxID=28214 RepID=UPI0017CF950F|nr:HAD-IB family phosphatase [Sphingomonas sp.]MBA4762550.1 HAD-IB family phosphatase [Sphingomonas sp.]
MRRLAIYDMDKTITRRATWTPFLVHAARVRAPWRLALLPLAGLASLAYLAKAIDRARLKEITHRLMIGRAIPPAELAVVAEAFADDMAATNLFADARARVEADRAAGWEPVLATASHGYYAQAIAARLHIGAVIATAARRDAHGNVLARLEGENCYGPAKLRLIEGWMAREGLSRGDIRVRFYSDHVSDAPVLEWADEPFAVNAHGPLRKLAAAKGWTVLDWEH